MSEKRTAICKCRLTELAVKKLKPERAPYLIWDAHQHGLAIRVQPTGARAWYAVYSHHGRPRWLRLGDAADAVGLGDARRLASELAFRGHQRQRPGGRAKPPSGAGHLRRTARAVPEYAKKHNRTGGKPPRWCGAISLPRWGTLQASTDQPRRRQGHDGAHRGADHRQSDAGGRTAIFAGRSRKRSDRQPVPAGRSQPDQEPRARLG